MRNRKTLIPLFLVMSVVVVVSAIGALQSPSTNSQLSHGANKHKTKHRDERWPIVDYNPPEHTSPKVDVKRHLKNERYNKQDLVPKPTSKSGDSEINLVNDWEVGFPALPVERSSVVLIGKVSGAQAYLSEDKTGIYSEFETQVERVLKNESSHPIIPDSNVIIERVGGRIRLPSGVQQFGIAHQGMPSVGGRYVFFLTGGEEQGLYLLTGYELREGLVFPLDGTHPADGAKLPQFAEYAGAAQTAFLRMLEDLLTKSQLK
jgi:hypothetical protein